MTRYLTLGLTFALAAAAMTAGAGAGDKLAVLKVGDEVYRNVTITGTNATDIYFTHAGGIGNAKLKKLEPELQQRFQFDAAKAAELEKKQLEANARYREQVSTNQSTVRSLDGRDAPPPTYDNGDVVAPKLYARSFRGQPAPPIAIAQWLTPSPSKKDMETRCALVVFWMTWAEPCRAAVPRLNEVAAKFGNRLVVICLSNETVDDIRKTPGMTVGFHIGTDRQEKTMRAFEVKAVPHAVLIDPNGIVRFEGQLGYLDNQALEHLLTRYSK